MDVRQYQPQHAPAERRRGRGEPWRGGRARRGRFKVVVGPPPNGVRSVDLRADKVPTANILLAMRVKDLTYSADLPLSGELKGELGRDGLPTYFRGKVTAGAGHIIDSDTPDYPMAIDSAEMNVEWDSGRRVLVAPFKIVSGANRITLLGHLEPPNGTTTEWQAGFSGGTIVLAGTDNEPPLIFNRIAIGMKLRHRPQARAADAGRYQQWRDRRRRYRQRRLFRRGAPTAGFCGNADVGVRAEADVADPDRARSARMGDRADRTRHAPAHRGRRQFAGAQSVAQGAADSG